MTTRKQRADTVGTDTDERVGAHLQLESELKLDRRNRNVRSKYRSMSVFSSEKPRGFKHRDNVLKQKQVKHI